MKAFIAWLCGSSSSLQVSKKPIWLSLRNQFSTSHHEPQTGPLPSFSLPACFHPPLGREQGGRWTCFSQRRLSQTTPRFCVSRSSFSLWFPLRLQREQFRWWHPPTKSQMSLFQWARRDCVWNTTQSTVVIRGTKKIGLLPHLTFSYLFT